MILHDPQSAQAAFGPSRAGFTDTELDESDALIGTSRYYLDRGMGIYLGVREELHKWYALDDLQATIAAERAARIAAAPAAAPAADAVGAPGGPAVSGEPVSDDDNEPGSPAAAAHG